MSETKYKPKFYALFASQQDKFGLSYRKDGEVVHTLPWVRPHKEDMRVFKHLTKGNVVVMGRNTFNSTSNKGFRDRTNVVVTSDTARLTRNAEVECGNDLFFVKNIDEAVELALRHATAKKQDVFFIGGKTLLDDLFSDHLDLLDGVYYAGIHAGYPPAIAPWDATEVNYTLFPTPTDIYKNPSVMTLDMSLHGDSVTYLKYVKTASPGELRAFQRLDMAENLAFYKDSFYTPSPSNEEIMAHESPTPTVADEKIIEAISASLNPLVVETAINPTFKRDRGMSGIDPFDVTTAWRESVDEMDKYLNPSSKVLPREKEPTESASEDNSPSLPSDFVGVATEIGELLVIKDAAYGSAFEKTKEILKILFPNGLPVEAFDDGLTIQRILDKICRLTVLCTNPDENKTDERTEDAWKDIAGYAIKALCEQRRKKNERN